ncbi:hypothetical protein HUG10_10280 [Halorarum halophilum]|uniref:Uncharacterized protein n=1 Tax=Halorarum halophilum TaxID=2743090 RepID=A0A7D5KE15_9EURY|nr:hypothetical protein [Halobaculum halophilum]QLG27917.1 hypothetical protein HUG10_10280 [Halobaculum halophilum]
MCHHGELAEWEEIRERLGEEEPTDEPVEADEQVPESDDGDDRPEVPTQPADD